MSKKGKEKEDRATAGVSVVPSNSMTKKLSAAEREERRRGPYVADFDRTQTFDLDIDPTVKRPFNFTLFGVIVKKGFSRLYNSPELSDVVLVLGDEKVPAHKTVLCVWSDTFRAMLDSGSSWKESTMEELVVDVEPEAYGCFKLMLKYMYTGDVSFINSDNVIPLIALTNYYGIHSLKEQCGELLGALVNDDNIFYLLDVSDNFDVKSLRSACCDHLAEHFGDMLDGDKLSELKPSSWVEMLQADNLSISSEQQVFEAIIRYANLFDGEPDKRDEILTMILPCVRYPFLPASYLVDTVEAEQSIQHLPIVRELIYEAFKYKLYPASISPYCPRIKLRCGFRFDPEQCHSQLALSEEFTKVSVLSSGGWMNVRCKETFTPKQNYIEFKVLGTGNYMLGLVDGFISDSCYAGQLSNGWSYYSLGLLHHAGLTPFSGQNYTTGDRIGIAVDYENNQFLFYKNGQLSITVPNIQITSELRPNVCMSSTGESVSILHSAIQPGTEKKGKRSGGKS